MDFNRLKGFLRQDREFFSNFDSQFFLQGLIAIDINFLQYLAIILHLGFFLTPLHKKIGKKLSVLAGEILS